MLFLPPTQILSLQNAIKDTYHPVPILLRIAPCRSGEIMDLLPALGHGTKGHCSKATGFIQPVHDAVLPGFVDGLRRGLHATCPAQDGNGSARASALDRHSFASCDSADCPAPPRSRWRAAACHRET